LASAEHARTAELRHEPGRALVVRRAGVREGGAEPVNESETADGEVYCGASSVAGLGLGGLIQTISGGRRGVGARWEPAPCAHA
jgi:hypothetical protein